METTISYKVVVTTPNLFNSNNPTQQIEKFTTRGEALKFIREPGTIKDRAKVTLVEVKEKIVDRYSAEATTYVTLKKQPKSLKTSAVTL